MVLSARFVRIIATRAPNTISAASPSAMNDRLLAKILPASRSGTTTTFIGAPGNRRDDVLDQRSADINGIIERPRPSMMAPVIWPRSALLHKAAASMVDGALALTLSKLEGMSKIDRILENFLNESAPPRADCALQDALRQSARSVPPPRNKLKDWLAERPLERRWEQSASLGEPIDPSQNGTQNTRPRSVGPVRSSRPDIR